MSCTTLLVGKNASWNGSTMIARNDDSGSGSFTPKKFTAVRPEDQPRIYESVISHVRIPLPDNPQRYTAMPNALKGEGIWAACGVNESDVAMTATETITSNPRVLGADPLVEYVKPDEDRNLYFGKDHVKRNDASVKTDDGGIRGGIGEEDLVVITLPYIKSAREGVRRLGSLLEKYGTYEENGIAFSDKDEVWWLESVGGHHWIARKVDDDSIVVMPNQLGIDTFDLEDAFGSQENHMCSADLREFIRNNHLDVDMHRDEDDYMLSDGSYNESRPEQYAGCDENGAAGYSGYDYKDQGGYGYEEYEPVIIRPRLLFGSHDDADHVYNTPRAWYMLKYFCPSEKAYDDGRSGYGPESDILPWEVQPEHRVTPEDVKYILSSHYQGTPYDPYMTYGDRSRSGAYRSIGINRNDFLGFVEIRGYMPEGCRSLEWIAFGSNVFNVMAPFYTNIRTAPEYISNTEGRVDTDNFYWSSRLIAAMADASYGKCQNVIERYNDRFMSEAHRLTCKWDRNLLDEANGQGGKAGDAGNGDNMTHADGTGIHPYEDSSQADAGQGIISAGTARDSQTLKREETEHGKEEKGNPDEDRHSGDSVNICEAANEEIADALRKETDKALADVLYFRSNEMKNGYLRSDH